MIMELYKKKFLSTINYVSTFLKWILIASIIGLIGGSIGSLFHVSVEFATGFRQKYNWLIMILPFGGIIIVWLYKLCKMPVNIGTNQVIDSIRSEEKVPFAMAPLIFASTVITHLLGGSAGREGAALQLGGSIGSQIGKIFRLDEKDMHLITLCGMSSVFSALFGTPLTATFFAMEVISVGVIYYSSFVPCLTSSIVAYTLSLLFNVTPVRYNLKVIPKVSLPIIMKIIVISVLCAGVSVVLCMIMRNTHELMKKKFKNEFLRIAVGGALIIVLTFLVGSMDYNGAGMDIISRAIAGEARPEAFLLKIIFTAITIGTGFKGGEIVPTFFIGSTFGCVVGGLLGIDPGFGAAIGLVALFCGVVNSPIASVILSIELFGSRGIILFAIACSISYMMSGYYGLYSSQKIMYSKLKAEFININAK
ncbi:MAG: Chloride/fluoride channel protein [Clostridium sp.]|jgi:H+/Cl- antiporter ClcA